MSIHFGKGFNGKIRKFLDGVFANTPTARRLQKVIDLGELQKVESVLNRHGFTFAQFENILEFGCRFGRLTQYFFDLAPKAKIFGCDIAHKEINKCRKKFPQGHFIHNQTSPPLPFVDHYFDFICSYSVFTHLSEENHASWLKEFSRLLKPGGVMVHTIHSYECLKRLRFFTPYSLEKYELPGGVEQFMLSKKPYHYAIDNKKMPEYGLAIIHEDYVSQMWARYTGMKLLEHAVGVIEAYLEGCQDIVLMAKV